MPKIRKRTSKRQTLRKKYSIQKKVKDSKKKIKKEAKKLKKQGIVARSNDLAYIKVNREQERCSDSQLLSLQGRVTEWGRETTWAWERNESTFEVSETGRITTASWTNPFSLNHVSRGSKGLRGIKVWWTYTVRDWRSQKINGPLRHEGSWSVLVEEEVCKGSQKDHLRQWSYYWSSRCKRSWRLQKPLSWKVNCWARKEACTTDQQSRLGALRKCPKVAKDLIKILSMHSLQIIIKKLKGWRCRDGRRYSW